MPVTAVRSSGSRFSLLRRCRRRSHMKFRFVLIPPEDDSGRAAAAHPASLDSEVVSYDRRGSHMVRRQASANGVSKRTPVANFLARIVSDIIRDDGAEPGR